MINKYPFHYEVRFRFLGFDKKNNVWDESKTKVFSEKIPLENRADAFEAFNDYFSFLRENKRLKKDEYGNYWIIQPPFVSEILNEKEVDFKEFEENDIYEVIEKHADFKNVFDQYKEEISVYLVVEDVEIVKNVLDGYEYNGKVKNEFEIHRVSSSSYDFQPQDLVDNLEDEVLLYEHFQINIENLKTTVYHYGLDYEEEGEDEEAAKRIILKTPYIWNNMERYNEIISSSQSLKDEPEPAPPSEDESTPTGHIDFKPIIERGEGNQIEFKPSLLYNFKTKVGGIGIKYIVARAICGFLNSNGGFLFIGVKDDGSIQGLDFDYSLFQGKNEKDALLLELDDLLVRFFGTSIKPIVNASIKNIESKDILVIRVARSPKPVFLKNNWDGRIEKEFYVRMNASTRQIKDPEDIVDYVFNKQWKGSNK